MTHLQYCLRILCSTIKKKKLKNLSRSFNDDGNVQVVSFLICITKMYFTVCLQCFDYCLDPVWKEGDRTIVYWKCILLGLGCEYWIVVRGCWYGWWPDNMGVQLVVLLLEWEV